MVSGRSYVLQIALLINDCDIISTFGRWNVGCTWRSLDPHGYNVLKIEISMPDEVIRNKEHTNDLTDH